MSTRSTTHFKESLNDPAESIVYRHSDGYPTGHGADLLAFFEEIKENVRDTRFTDESILAARLVVWLGKQFATTYERNAEGKYEEKPTHYLDFLSVRVLLTDPGDIEYRYVVLCNSDSLKKYGRPAVLVYEVNLWGDYPKERLLGEISEVLAREEKGGESC